MMGLVLVSFAHHERGPTATDDGVGGTNRTDALAFVAAEPSGAREEVGVGARRVALYDRIATATEDGSGNANRTQFLCLGDCPELGLGFFRDLQPLFDVGAFDFHGGRLLTARERIGLLSIGAAANECPK
jgi:hypothetical protein